jgi:hypothetical protein
MERGGEEKKNAKEEFSKVAIASPPCPLSISEWRGGRRREKCNDSLSPQSGERAGERGEEKSATKLP